VIVPGTPAFVGVEDPNGFTDLAIVAVGGATQAYIADQFSFLPPASFAPLRGAGKCRHPAIAR
jgi:hypothetical protein